MGDDLLLKGELRTDSGDLILRPGMAEAEFVTTPLGRMAKPERNDAQTTLYQLPRFMAGGVECDGIVYFESGTPALMTFLPAPPAGSTPWDIEADKRRCDAWMSRRFGKTSCDFPWGRIASTVDRRSGLAAMFMQYARKR